MQQQFSGMLFLFSEACQSIHCAMSLFVYRLHLALPASRLLSAAAIYGVMRGGGRNCDQKKPLIDFQTCIMLLTYIIKVKCLLDRLQCSACLRYG